MIFRTAVEYFRNHHDCTSLLHTIMLSRCADILPLALVLLLPCMASSFVLNSDCIAPAPCTCSGSTIQCDNKNLQTVPPFRHSNISSSSWIQFYLNGNNITAIGPNAFCNISFSKNTRINMELTSNKLNNLSSTAFNCIDTNIVNLSLCGNNFSVLPRALEKLVNLSYLNVDSNPLATLDPDVMSVIGGHLQTFDVDLSHFTSWPHEFRLLRAINTLSLSNIPFSRLSTDAFHGVESTLHSLIMTNSHLERMPIAICHLQNLQSLKFFYNSYLNLNTTIIEPCNKRLNSVTTLLLYGNNLRNFPDFFHTFPQITFLHLDSNKLRYINGDLIPANNGLQTLLLNSNNFSRIPDAVNKFHSLTQLEMQSNHIGAIYDIDLHNLTALTILYLNNNGLKFISSHAFRNNPKLNNLGLHNNLLRTISSSIATLHSLSTLNLQNNHIECTCDLSHLQSWNVTSFNLYGNCETSSVTLKQFLMNALSGCQ